MKDTTATHESIERHASDQIAVQMIADSEPEHSHASVIGKGRHARVVPFGAQTARALDRYLRIHGPGDPLLEEALVGDPSSEAVDASPAAVYATLLDEGTYLASERTMYRFLEASAEVRERRGQLCHPAYARPELRATGPTSLGAGTSRSSRVRRDAAHSEPFVRRSPTPPELPTKI